MKFEIGAMTVGDILDRGLKLLLARLPTFYAINLIVLSPLLLLRLAVPALEVPTGTPQEQATWLAGGIFLQMVILLILQPIATAAVLHVIAQAFVGEQAGLGEAFRFALHRFGRLLGASLLAGLTIGVGFMLCCVPGIFFAIWYAFVSQVVVVEGLRATGAMARSKDLSEGYRGRVLGLFALLFIAQFVLNMGIGAMNNVLPSAEMIPAEGGPRFVVNYTNHAIQVIVATLVNILVQTYYAICLTLLYFDLRIRKEGFDLELAARQQASIVS